jgi:hypothetical protein
VHPVSAVSDMNATPSDMQAGGPRHGKRTRNLAVRRSDSVASRVTLGVEGTLHMITRHHFAIMITIGVALAVLAIAIAMEPGIARGIF